MSIPPFLETILPFFHPILMWVALGLAIYALYLGVQVQRTRVAEGELKKELVKGRFAVKHYQIGSLLLTLWVLGALAAMGVTYILEGKLILGPHLLSGLGIVGLVAVSASLAPLMQKGQNWARYVHISLNMVILGLLSVQAVTGVQIVQKLLSPS
jgi:uncharacterized membrane protein YozB (DUF420 family)